MTVTPELITALHHRAATLLRVWEHVGSLIVVDELDARVGLMAALYSAAYGTEWDLIEADAIYELVAAEMEAE